MKSSTWVIFVFQQHYSNRYIWTHAFVWWVCFVKRPRGRSVVPFLRVRVGSVAVFQIPSSNTALSWRTSRTTSWNLVRRSNERTLKERNTQAASGTLCYDQGFSRNLAQCSDVSECIGMYRNVLALLFILPRMYWNVSECIGFTFHTPQDDPIHSDTFQYIHFQSRRTINILCLNI